MKLEVNDWERLINRTVGVSGAFIRELLRKAAVFAADDSRDGELLINDDHLSEALTELLVAGGPLTQTLLGTARPSGASES